MLLFAFSALFWAAFEQAGSSLNLFAEHRTRLSLLGFTFPASTLQSVNSMFIWMFAPVLAWLWLLLEPIGHIAILVVIRVVIRQRVIATNQLIAADCKTDPRCQFVDVDTPMLDAQGQYRPELFRDDQLHLNSAGYAIWTKVLAPYLKE